MLQRLTRVSVVMSWQAYTDNSVSNHENEEDRFETDWHKACAPDSPINTGVEELRKSGNTMSKSRLTIKPKSTRSSLLMEPLWISVNIPLYVSCFDSGTALINSISKTTACSSSKRLPTPIRNPTPSYTRSLYLPKLASMVIFPSLPSVEMDDEMTSDPIPHGTRNLVNSIGYV
jgi:hypothetical protein